VSENKFKVGDIVEYFRTGPIGWESEDWADTAGLPMNVPLHITKIDPVRNVVIKEARVPYVIHPYHFRLWKEKSNKRVFRIQE